MRLWSLHPKYLDAKGLVALWREALLAQKVLKGGTRGYRNHPQLGRFRDQPDPVAAISKYLAHIHAEAMRRGYRFDGKKIEPLWTVSRIPCTRGQLLYEWEHLKSKVKPRDPGTYQELLPVTLPEPHPLFFIRSGDVESWERGAYQSPSR